MAVTTKIKKRCLNDIRRRSLKVVLQRMDLPNIHKQKKELIDKLICNEKKLLNFQKGDSGSEDESRKKIIILLEKEKNIIFNENKMKLEESIIEIRRKKQRQKVIFPVIPKHKMDQMLSLLKSNRNLSAYQKKLSNCLSHMHTSAKPPWNSPSVILKAMKDCILRRKWDNLTHLLVILIHLPSVKYKPIIRHMCQILDKYHPIIERNGLQNQFNMITVTNHGTKMENTELIITNN